MPLVVVATAWAGVHAPYHFFFLLALPRASLCYPGLASAFPRILQGLQDGDCH